MVERLRDVRSVTSGSRNNFCMAASEPSLDSLGNYAHFDSGCRFVRKRPIFGRSSPIIPRPLKWANFSHFRRSAPNRHDLTGVLTSYGSHQLDRPTVESRSFLGGEVVGRIVALSDALNGMVKDAAPNIL